MHKCVGKLFLAVSMMLFSSAAFSLDFDVPDQLKNEYECMVRNLHHEARGENSKGMVAVANVVMNRANHPNFPQTVCGVIYERFQFSWVGKVKPVVVSRADDTAKLIAYEAVVNKTLKDNTGGALFFHATYSRFTWNTSKVIVTRKVGDHIFYKYRSTNGKKKVN